MAASCYVYYRVAPEHSSIARERVAALFDYVARASSVHGRLLTRSGEPDLWMEVYEPVEAAEPFASILASGVRELGLEQVLASNAARTLECFEEVCA